ncbi:MAG: hypothetical protein V7K92_22630 [Nostoc sp.]
MDDAAQRASGTSQRESQSPTAGNLPESAGLTATHWLPNAQIRKQ